MHQVKYGLFFDNHTHMEIPEVGRDFDPEYFTDRLVECGVDYLTFHARCNVGMAYYDTKIGTRHPSLDYDLFGALAECCRKTGIALVAYLNGGGGQRRTLGPHRGAPHYECLPRPRPGSGRDRARRRLYPDQTARLRGVRARRPRVRGVIGYLRQKNQAEHQWLQAGTSPSRRSALRWKIFSFSSGVNPIFSTSSIARLWRAAG